LPPLLVLIVGHLSFAGGAELLLGGGAELLLLFGLEELLTGVELLLLGVGGTYTEELL
jgi:hypothetical protein